MQINNHINGAPLTPQRRPEDVGSAAAGGGKAEAAADVTTSIALRELQGLPETRADLVARVRQRLQAGEYLTRDAASSTASALLNAN
ncbi:MAG: flagellar biosynthesis anti-sigma factor FlgM [Planctomycetales bacterium]|nr:flagellar biosynthesis anti-sigma factor FlgM [Planctomycetales bacterium]